MQNNQSRYEFDALIKDESFRAWVIENDSESDVLWTQTIALLPQYAKNIHFAKTFLLSLETKTTDLTRSQLSDITNNIIAQVAKQKVYS